MLGAALFLMGCGPSEGQKPESGDEAVAKRVLPQRGTIASPDGHIHFNIQGGDGHLKYSVTMDKLSVIQQSNLGMRFLKRAALDGDVVIIGIEKSSSDTTWEQPWGERKSVRDHHNELLVRAYSQQAKLKFNIRVRVFNDGLGFRYEMPDQQGLKDIAIMDELTDFSVGQNTESWWIPSRMYNRYEYLYRQTPVADIQQVHTPVTLKNKDGIHISLHEAALVNYSSMSLKQTREGVLEAELAPRSDGAKVRLSGGFKTPWRTIQISKDAVGLLNSDLILNLNEPNKLGDVSWIEIGKYAGIWWDMHIRNKTWGQFENDKPSPHGATTEHAKKYIDFAAENNFIGVLVEGWNVGWDNDWFSNGDVFSFTKTYDDFDIAEVTRYAAEKGTRLIGHHETSGSISNYENQLEAALDLYQKMGVRAIKTGYVADDGDIKWIDDTGMARYEYHDSQRQIEHHLRVVQRAAEHKIIINAHEPVKDTGLRRTYPNWITREGARGQEFNAWAVPPNGPDHVSNLIFTRMLSGPMDYTPGAFNLRPSELPESEGMSRHNPKSRIEHTLAKELALYVVLYSPIQMVVDTPESYAKRPDAFQFIKDVPTDWDKTIALSGEVGEFAVFARKDRQSDDWFVGGITNRNARKYKLDLSFLTDGDYEAQIYRDGNTAHYDTAPYDMEIKSMKVKAGDKLDMNMAAGGGFAIRLQKLP